MVGSLSEEEEVVVVTEQWSERRLVRRNGSRHQHLQWREMCTMLQRIARGMHLARSSSLYARGTGNTAAVVVGLWMSTQSDKQKYKSCRDSCMSSFGWTRLRICCQLHWICPASHLLPLNLDDILLACVMHEFYSCQWWLDMS